METETVPHLGRFQSLFLKQLGSQAKDGGISHFSRETNSVTYISSNSSNSISIEVIDVRDLSYIRNSIILFNFSNFLFVNIHMALSSDYFEVVGDISCRTSFRGLVEPDEELQCPKFLINFVAIIGRLCATRIMDQEEMTENYVGSSIELQYNPNDSTRRDLQRIILSNKLRELLQIPVESRLPLVDKILVEAEKMEHEYSSFASRRVLHMDVLTELDVIDSR